MSDTRRRIGYGRLAARDSPLHLRQPADLDRDHVEPAPLGAGRGGGIRRDPHGAERAGARAGSETMKRLSLLMAVAFVDMIGLMMVFPLLPLYALRLHADPATIGVLSASVPIAQ